VDDGVDFAAKEGKPSTNEIMNIMADGLEDIGFEASTVSEVSAKATTTIRCFSKSRYVRGAEESVAHEAPKCRGVLVAADVGMAFGIRGGGLRAVRSVVEIWIWAAVVCRTRLSMPGSLFHFRPCHFPRRAKWWEVARKEIRLMASLVPALEHQTHMVTWPVVFATDTEGHNREDAGGFGVVVAAFDIEKMTGSARPSFTVAEVY